MNKRDLATQIFNDLIDYIDDSSIDKKDEVIENIQGRLNSYLIIDGGLILKDDKGNSRI